MKKFPSCNLTLPKDTFNSYIYDWFMPTNGSPDIFSKLVDQTCISSNNSSYPKINQLPVASHEPRTGNNYAGIAVNDYYREYLEVKLSEPLIPGQVYCCEMYVSFNSSSLFANDCLAMQFSENMLVGEDDFFVGSPQIKTDSIITDSINWVRIHGNFKAITAANYLTIGNFSGIGTINYKAIGSNSEGVYAGAYYYIDDISVQKVELANPIITGNKTVCPGDTLVLEANGWDNITWHNLGDPAQISSNNILKIPTRKSITKYLVKGSLCDWPVQYIVTIQFYEEPVFDIGKDTLICEGTTIQLDPGNGLKDFHWQDGSQNSTYAASLAGKYKLIALNNFGCKGADSIVIGYYEAPTFSLGDDFEQCETKGTLYASTGHNYDHYLWNDLSTNTYLNYFQEGTYWITVTNPCGVKKEDTITIQKVELYMPNLITTNDDKLNDKLVLIGAKEGKGSLFVYNRNGSRVFINDHYFNNWPTEDLPEGIYYYEFKYPTCEVRKSWVQVIK